MSAPLINERDLVFILYELFDTEALTDRDRYQEHNRETFNATLKTAQTIAQKYLLPIRQKVDTEQPTFDGHRVHMVPEIKTAMDAIIESGPAFCTAGFETGSMQLPPIVAGAANAYLTAAGSTTIGYTGLTNANLIEAHGSKDKIKQWLIPMHHGHFASTIAMTEPGAGSGLADLTTSAENNDDGSYSRITGNKIFIPGGDHELNEDIVHLVLARRKGAPKGIKGISLFIVPKFLINPDGSVGEPMM